MADFIKSSVDILSTSALWYAWGRIDQAQRDSADVGFNLSTDHGIEFQNLYTEIARQYQDGEVTSRPSVLDAWARFVATKQANGWDVLVDVEDIASYRPSDPSTVPAQRGMNADDI